MISVVVGASAGLGRCLAERLAEAGHDLFLVAQDARDLTALAADLELVHGVAVAFLACDITLQGGAELRHEVTSKLGAPTYIFLVAGEGAMDDCGPLPDQMVDRLLSVNMGAPVKVVNAFLDDILDGTVKTIVAIGSVASIRARGTNMVYGAAKTGLEFYVQAVRHFVAASGCRVQFYRVGFMKTSMLDGRSIALPAVEPEIVARRIVSRIDRWRGGVAYLPAWWVLIAVTLRSVPWGLFRRLKI